MDKLGIQEMPRPLLGGEQVASETGPRSKLFCCSCVRRWIPLVYREELLKVLHLTGPLLVSRILSFLLPFVTTIFCGHLGNAELAGYALASATINVTTAATGYGLSLACDTLVSQTFGSKNLKRVGEILQRSILILLLFCLPCWAILINTESILLSLRQEAEVARTAQLYVFAFLPAVPAMFLHQLQVAYLQNQGIILPQLYGAAVANILNVGTNYVLIFWMDLGVKGSAASNSMSQIYNCFLLFVYIRWKKLHIKTWGGWSTASLQEWGSFMQLAIPSTLMLCFEWWIYEIGGFLAGMLGELDLAAQHILLELGAITYMFPLGVHTAACVRVGNELGAGDTTRALITSKVSLTLSGVLAVLQSIVLGSTKSVIGFIFTTDVKIVELVSETLNLYVFLQFFDALVCVSSGILLGAGKQKIAAIANLICYYCVGVPVGVSLMFAAEMRIFGLWLGLLICVIMQAGFFTTLIFKLNWQQLAEEAQRRAGKGRRMTCLAKPPIGEENVIDSLVPENLVGLKLPLESVVIQAVSEGSKPPLCTPVSTQEQCKAGQEGGGTKTDLLSIGQLVLRRGLALLVCLLILATGVAAHFVFPPLDVPGPQPDNLTLGWGNITLGWDNSSSSILLFNNTYTSIQ